MNRTKFKALSMKGTGVNVLAKASNCGGGDFGKCNHSSNPVYDAASVKCQACWLTWSSKRDKNQRVQKIRVLEAPSLVEAQATQQDKVVNGIRVLEYSLFT